MDKRFFLALALSAIVIVLTQLIFPQPKRAPIAPGGAAVTDTLSPQNTRRDSAPAAPTASAAGAPTAVGAGGTAAQVSAPGGDSIASASAAPARVITVPSGRAIYGISTVGAAPVSAVLEDY